MKYAAFELPFIAKALICPYFLAFPVIHHLLELSLIELSQLQIWLLVLLYLKHPIFEISHLKGSK